MSRESDALAEVIAAPDDDVPRMAYADLLVARGDPRGEFIRVQCALANGDVEFLEKQELRERAGKLLLEHEKSWRELAGIADKIQVEWRRGFIDEATLTGEQFAGEIGEQLFAREPVRHARIRVNSERVAKKVGEAPHLTRLSALTLDGLSGGSVLEPILAADLTALRGANFGGMVDPESLPTVTSATSLSNLERLSLSGSDIGGAFGDALRDWQLVSLQTLFASRCGLLDEDLVALAESAALTQLVTLCVARNEYGATGVRALVDSPNNATLETIELDMCNADAMRSLAECKELSRVKRVTVAGYQWRLPSELRDGLKKRFGRRLRWE
ncbi:MAG: TIGR02996 domain-containing protein [Myxococcales bacterium]|nr:TIGR02996 domain-containing protein [Myxococcales bacterium]